MENKSKYVADLLSGLLAEMESLGSRIRFEGKVFAAEQEDAFRLGLVGEDRIVHYNEWMRKAGLFDLVVS